MKGLVTVKSMIVFLSLFYLVNVQEAYAYLDPGTGSYLFQILVGILLGALFAVKLYWGKIKLFFKQIFIRGDTHDKDEK